MVTERHRKQPQMRGIGSNEAASRIDTSTVVGLRGQIAHRIGVQLGGGPRQWPVESAEAGKPDCRAVGWAALWLRPTCVECVAVAPAGESAHAGGL